MADETKGGAFHGDVGDVGDVGQHVASPSDQDLDAVEAERQIARATYAPAELSAKEQLIAALVRVGYNEEEAHDLAAAAIAQVEERAAGAGA
jgi:SOS response regulatory protein OraA/RecX